MAHPSVTSTFAGPENQGLQVSYNSGNIVSNFHPAAERPETPPHPSSTIPFRRDPDFIDRGTVLDQLHKKCSSPASRTALVGFGGVGKSQLAIEYGYRTRERSQETWVFWIHGGSTARLEQSFQDIANHAQISGRKDPKANIFKLVHDWLSNRKSGQWLLILDNIDDAHFLPVAECACPGAQRPDMDSKGSRPLSAYLPQSENGSILVTSRSKAVALKLVEEKDIIAVEPMAQSHALALFEKKLGSLGEDDDLTELTAALEFMPLAIVQAAAYISERAPRYSTGQYLEDFRKGDRRKTSLLNYEGGQLRRDWEAKNSIIITWQISFEHIQRNRPSAADLLSLMSFFDRQGIPEVLVRNRDENRSGHISQKGANKHGGGEEEEDNEDNASESNEDDGFEEDVQILRNYSFLSVDTNRTFEMHALVQLAMRKWLEANGKLEQWKQCYIKNLSAEFPIGEYENWTYCQVLFPHAKSAVTQPPKGDGSLRKWASLLYNAAWYAWRKGIITEAVNLSEMAMEVSKKIFGQEHRETLRFISMAGLAYALGGRWKEAEELRVRVTEIRKRVLGDEHPETLISMANLASTYINQGRWKEAEELQIEQITIMKRVLGEQHPDMLIGMANLASIYRDQGRWKEAEELQVRVTEIRKRVLGEEHPETLTSMNNLAFTWKRQGRNAKAIELMGQCVHLRTRIIGADHPKTLSSSTLLTKWQMADTRTED